MLRGGKLVTDDAEEILKRLLRLVQVASNPLLVDESYKGEPGKLPAARRLVDRALADGSKVILWTNFIANADWLGRQFRDRAVSSFTEQGDRRPERRARQVQE